MSRWLGTHPSPVTRCARAGVALVGVRAASALGNARPRLRPHQDAFLPCGGTRRNSVTPVLRQIISDGLISECAATDRRIAAAQNATRTQKDSARRSLARDSVGENRSVENESADNVLDLSGNKTQRMTETITVVIHCREDNVYIQAN
jgi:hypothetical protein